MGEANANRIAGPMPVCHPAPMQDGYAPGMTPSALAVVGVGFRGPAGLCSAADLATALRDGVDAVTAVPLDRWTLDPADGALPTFGAFVENADRFDPGFFRVSPRDARALDPQHRLLLEVCWEALEDAGLDPRGLEGSETGVFVGLSGDDYRALATRRPGAGQLYERVGTTSATASGRLAYFFGFRGPAVSIDTASSSSLVALHLAAQSLHAGDTDLALAAGVNLILTADQHVAFGRAGMLAPDGRCKVFDARANGFVRGEGCGVVVLKRYADAVRDGDRILARVLGSAINQDGASEGLMAPSEGSQIKVIRRALERAGVEPRDIDLVEAHGTGTPLGDRTEARALMAVFGDQPRRAPLTVGSLKANIGHLGAAAGIAGVIKVVALFEAGIIPRQLNFEALNPALRPFDARIVTETVPWAAQPGRVRRAGISSFGFSGTNAHAVLAEEPARSEPLARSERSARLLALSARDRAALSRLAGRYARHLRRHPEAHLADVCHSANRGRAHFAVRAAVVAGTTVEAAEALERLACGEDPAPAQAASAGRAPRVAFLFAGHGTQHRGMLRELYHTHPVVKRAVDRCARVLDPLLDRPLLPALFDPSADPEPLDRDAIGQPATFVVQYALAQLWCALGVEPSLIVGHSLGEYAAACIAGVLALDDALALVATRGALVETLPPGGAMVAVRTSAEAARAAIGDRRDVCVGVVNGPESVVLSGSSAGIDQVLGALPDVSATRIDVSFGSHSPEVDRLLGAFTEAVEGIEFSAPRVPLIPSSGRHRQASDMCRPAYWVRHLRDPVDFAGAMARTAQFDVDVFIEISPRPVLLGMARDCVDDPDRAAWLPSTRPERADWAQFASSVAAVYTRGAQLDWRAFAEGDPHLRRPLPTYPFGGERYWIEAPAARVGPSDAPDRTALRFDFDLGRQSPAYLASREVRGAPRLPAAVCFELVLTCASDIMGPGLLALHGVRIDPTIPLPADPAQTTRLRIRLHRMSADAFAFRLECDAGRSTRAPEIPQGSGRVLRTTDEPTAPMAVDRSRCPEPLDVDGLYDAWARRGLVHRTGPEGGADFRVVEALWRGPDGQAVGDLRLDDTLVAEARSYAIHPLLLDGALQVARAVLPAGAALWMPAAVGSLTVARREAPVMQATVAAQVVRCSDDIAVVQITMADADGTLAGFDRLEFTRPFAAEVVAAADPAPGPRATWRERLAAAAPDARPAVIDRYVRARLGQVLGTPDTVDAGLTLRDLGADSLVGAELSRHVDRDLGLTVPAGRITGHDRTVGDLIALLAARLEQAGPLPTPAAEPREADAPGAPDPTAASAAETDAFAAAAARVPQIHATVSAQKQRQLLIDGRWVADFASCNYLGLDLHPEVMAAIPPAIARWGVHPSWTRAVASPGIYTELEDALAELVGAPAVLVFPSITLLHAGLLPVLAGYDGVIIKDIAAHRSVHEGCLLAQSNGARMVEFAHNDVTDLEARLAECPPHVPKIVAIDGVYSMSGAYPPLPAFAELARRYDAWIYIDDAHGLGVVGESPTPEMPYGRRGNGVVRHFGLDYARDRMIYVSGLSKSYSSFGAFVTCVDEPTRAHYKSASTFIFSGPSPIASLASAIAGLTLNRTEGEAWRAQIFRLTRRLVAQARALGFEVVNNNDFPIVGVVIGETEDVVDACGVLWDHGLLITPALYPIVPVGRGLLRFSITAANTEGEVDQALRALADVRRMLTERGRP